MRSDLFPVAAAILFASACGLGVDDLSLPAPPLVTVKGHVDLSEVRLAAAGKPLRAALVWGAVPNYVLTCLKFPLNAELKVVCPDPFGFVPGQVEADVPVSSLDGSFSIPVLRLPDASVSVGNDVARIAWGSVVVAADSDGDGAFALLKSSGERGQTVRLADTAVAASFFSLQAPQQRVAFREGGWNDNSYFYPASGCRAPPPGFSILATPGMTAKSSDCKSSGLDAVVETTALFPDEARGLACRAVNRASVRQPDADAPGSGHGPGPDPGPGEIPDRQLCLDAQTLVLIGSGDCPTITTMPLSGCRSDLVCQEPDWDYRAEPPSWWPCK